MPTYRRVTFEDRCQIYAYLERGDPYNAIATRLGFHRSTIGREIRRNRGKHGYCAVGASEKAGERYARCRRKLKITGELEERIEKLILEDWSPEQIQARLKQEKRIQISLQTIYTHAKRRQRAWRKRFRRIRRGRGSGRYAQQKLAWKGRKMIWERPSIANQRKRLGDWERDCMHIAQHKQLLVVTDRKSRFTQFTRLENMQPITVKDDTLQLLRRSKGPIRTLTNDNGPEFREFRNLGVPVFHCSPQRPQQRGTVENTIGLLRQYFSRKTPPQEVTDRRIQEIERRLNFRPRKCLDFRTPFEVFYNTSVALVS